MARTQPTLIGRVGFAAVRTADGSVVIDLQTGTPGRLEVTTFPVRTIEEAGTTGSFTTLPGMTTVDVTAIGAARPPGGYQASPGSAAGGGAGGGACVHHAAMPVFHPETVVCHGGYLGGPSVPLLESSWWRHPTTLMATYGQFGNIGTTTNGGGQGGLGGLAANCIVPAGGTATNGGNGANGNATFGGGGGGAGGTTTNGANGVTAGAGGAGGSLYGGTGNGGGGTGTPFNLGPGVFPDTIGEYGGGGGGTDQATNDIAESGRGRVRVEGVGFWDPVFQASDGTARTMSMFVDVGAASAIELQDNMSYVGGFWVSAPGNVGIRIGGVQTANDVEIATFASTLVYLYNYGTKPLATFEDTAGATLVSTFLNNFPAVVAEPDDLLVGVIDVTGGQVECAPTTIRVRKTQQQFGDWNFATFIGMTDVDVIAIASGAAGGTTTTAAGGGGGGGGGGYAYGNCLVSHPESIPVHSGTNSDSWFRASTPSSTAVVATKGLPGSGANGGAGGAGGGGGGGTGGGVFAGGAGGAGVAATFISVPLGFRGGGGGAGGAGGGPASSPIAGENCPAVGHVYTEPPPGTPVDNGWPNVPSNLNYNFGGRGATGGGLVVTATPSSPALYVADGGYGGGHVQLVNPGGGSCLGAFNPGTWNRQFSAFGGGGGGGGNINFPSSPTGGSAGNGIVRVTGTGQWDAIFTAVAAVGLGRLTIFVDTAAPADIDIRLHFSFESGVWVAAPGTLGLKITGLTTVANVEASMTSFVSFSQNGVVPLATFEDTAGATLEVLFTPVVSTGTVGDPSDRWTRLRINGSFNLIDNGSSHRQIWYGRAFNVSPAYGNLNVYLQGFSHYQVTGAVYIFRNVAPNPFTTLDSLDDSRTQASSDDNVTAIVPSTIHNLTVDPTQGASGALTEREQTELFIAILGASINNGTNFDQAVAAPTSTPTVNYPTLVFDSPASVALTGERTDLFHATPPVGTQPIANFVSSFTSGASGAGSFQVIGTAALLRAKLTDISIPYFSQRQSGWNSLQNDGTFSINTSNTIRRNDFCVIAVDVTCDLPPGVVVVTAGVGQGTVVPLLPVLTSSDTTRHLFSIKCTDTTTLDLNISGTGWGAFPTGFAQASLVFYIDVDTTNPIVHLNTTSDTKALSATIPDGAFILPLAPVADDLTDLLVVMLGLATIDPNFELPWLAPQGNLYERQIYSAGFPDLRPRYVETYYYTIGGVITYDSPLESILPAAGFMSLPHAMTPSFTNPTYMATVFATSIVLRGSAGPTPPPPTAGVIIINIITPNSGFSKLTPIVIDVYSTVTSLRRAWINASYAGLSPDDLVHNGDRFGAAYQGSTNTRVSITNGYRFTLLRDGGWPGAPSIDVHAVDTFGNGDE